MTESKHELNDQELNDANGGGTFDFLDYMFPDSAIKNFKGEECGWYTGGKLKYRPCDKCGKPTHHGTSGIGQGLFYCDPCDEHYYAAAFADWNGDEGDLMAASL